MNVTFPHFGPLSITLKQMMNHVGVSYVLPPENNDESLRIGSALCPEEMCLPFKYMAGNLKMAYELGADTAVMMATGGPCRLGEYCELLKTVLDKAGCRFEWILLDSPSEIGSQEFAARVKLLCSGNNAKCSSTKITEGLMRSLRLIKSIDRFRSSIMQSAGYLECPGEAVRLLKDTMAGLEEASDFRECFDIIKKAEKTLAAFAHRDGAEPVKILIAGEIYTSVEPAANGSIEEMLAELGCSVRKHIDISWWIKYTLKESVLPGRIRDKTKVKDAIDYNIGGYGRETSARIIMDDWSDGVIKLMPAGCMPEIVTKAFCENVEKDKNLKVLNLIYDELKGEAGYETRVEAFVDMLERRKRVLAGN